MYPTLFLLQASANPIFGTLFMYVAIAAIFYFILWRPQQRQRKQHEQTIRSLKRGDEIVTAGGIVGEVVHIKERTAGQVTPEDQITIRSGESRLVVERGRIVRVGSAPGAAAPGA
jgi:preprotein translocase subunit YajC